MNQIIASSKSVAKWRNSLRKCSTNLHTLQKQIKNVEFPPIRKSIESFNRHFYSKTHQTSSARVRTTSTSHSMTLSVRWADSSTTANVYDISKLDPLFSEIIIKTLYYGSAVAMALLKRWFEFGRNDCGGWCGVGLMEWEGGGEGCVQYCSLMSYCGNTAVNCGDWMQQMNFDVKFRIAEIKL